MKRPSAALLVEHRPKDEGRFVRFQHYDPAAREVFLAGSFNNWQPRQTPMTRLPDGNWEAGLQLKPGQYEYRLVIDGQWQDDLMAARFVANPYGTLNSVVQVRGEPC